MIFIDRLLAAGVHFVLDKLERVANSDTEDPAQLREALLEAQMQLELGEITEEQFVELEASLMVRLRAIRQRELDAAEGMEVSGVEISVDRALDGAD